MYRILQVVTHMNRGGLETMIMNYYRHIDRTKVQFDFLTHREYDGDYGEEIKQLGGKIYHLPTLNPFSRHYLRSLRNFFLTHPEYTVIHVHQDCMSSVILKEAKKCGVPVRIAHSHNINQEINIKYIIKMYYKRFIPQYSTHLFACSRAAGIWMFEGAQFIVLKNAIEADSFAFDESRRWKKRQALGVERHELLVGHVGRFNIQKNHVFLVDIFNEIQKCLPAKLLLLGGGELRGEIETRIKELGLVPKVIMMGVRPDVSEMYQAMDVFVFPSLYEGLGIVAIEAQASGLPCLISDHVPEECKITQEVWQLPLEASPEIWARQAIEAVKAPRRDTFEEIQSAGYDIESNAEWLQRFYLKELDNLKLEQG